MNIFLSFVEFVEKLLFNFFGLFFVFEFDNLFFFIEFVFNVIVLWLIYLKRLKVDFYDVVF